MKENSTPSRAAKTHLKVRLETGLADELAGYARRHDLTVSAVVRSSLHALLAVETAQVQLPAAPPDQAAILATLIAVEQTRHLLQTIVPDSDDTDEELLERAADAAHNRLQEVEHRLREVRL